MWRCAGRARGTRQAQQQARGTLGVHASWARVRTWLVRNGGSRSVPCTQTRILMLPRTTALTVHTHSRPDCGGLTDVTRVCQCEGNV
jgi:hypothetical protein